MLYLVPENDLNHQEFNQDFPSVVSQILLDKTKKYIFNERVMIVLLE